MTNYRYENKLWLCIKLEINVFEISLIVLLRHFVWTRLWLRILGISEIISGPGRGGTVVMIVEYYNEPEPLFLFLYFFTFVSSHKLLVPRC